MRRGGAGEGRYLGSTQNKCTSAVRWSLLSIMIVFRLSCFLSSFFYLVFFLLIYYFMLATLSSALAKLSKPPTTLRSPRDTLPFNTIRLPFRQPKSLRKLRDTFSTNKFISTKFSNKILTSVLQTYQNLQGSVLRARRYRDSGAVKSTLTASHVSLTQSLILDTSNTRDLCFHQDRFTHLVHHLISAMLEG